jgi:hypothetical protein
VIPDVQVDRVHREGMEPGWVTGIEPVQPEEDGLWHLSVSDRPFDGFRGAEVRACRIQEGRWTDVGSVETESDPSIHPDLKGRCADYVVMARRAISAIPRGAWITLELICTRSSAGGDEVAAVTTFNARGDISQGRPVHVTDDVLDHVPGIRYLERTGPAFAEMFGMEPYNDGSGVSGDFKMLMSADAMTIICQDPESGTKITLESETNEGVWGHHVVLDANEFQSDAMGTLRRLKDDAFALASLFDDCEETNPMSVLLGIGIEQQVPVLETQRQDQAAGPIRFILEPGRLR